MQIFIDSGDIDEIREAMSWGVVDGVTTNPSLVRAASLKRGIVDLKEYLSEICNVAGRGRPVSLEVMGTNCEQMVKEAKIIYDKFNTVAKNVVVKIPVTTKGIEEDEFEGIKAIRQLDSRGIPVNATLIMTPMQAMLAAKAGAKYVSPFLGRIDDYVRQKSGINFKKEDYFDTTTLRRNANDDALNFNEGILSGIELLLRIRKSFANYNIKAKVIAASIRNTRQAEESMEAGAEIITAPYEVIKNMTLHTKSEEGIKLFVEDAKKAKYIELFS
ncbi:MAG: transaldolase [Nitrososphaerota archaeon]|nr:transaldolase [Nitrososphaerota archaeon]